MSEFGQIKLGRIGLGEFAAMLELDGGADRWYRLLLPTSANHAMVAEHLALEIASALGSTCQCTDAGAGPAELVRLVRAAGENPVAIYGVDEYSDADWQHVDLLRSQLVGGSTKVLLARPSVIAKMESHAPHLTSFFGGATWQIDLGADYLSKEEQQERLLALRHALGYSDDEVIALAQAHRLPSEPEFAEWLVLLDRGDLL